MKHAYPWKNKMIMRKIRSQLSYVKVRKGMLPLVKKLEKKFEVFD